MDVEGVVEVNEDGRLIPSTQWDAQMRNRQDTSHDEVGKQVRLAHRGSLYLNNVFAIDGMGGFVPIERSLPYMSVQTRNICGPRWIGCIQNQLKGEMDF